jgi:hypothetical protein
MGPCAVRRAPTLPKQDSCTQSSSSSLHLDRK